MNLRILLGGGFDQGEGLALCQQPSDEVGHGGVHARSHFLAQQRLMSSGVPNRRGSVPHVSERANQGKPFRDYKTVTTNSAGVYGFRAPHAKGRRYRVRWTAPDGHVFNGPPIRSY